MTKTLMIAAAIVALSPTTLAGAASARIDCHHDPVCQAKRDGTSVNAAASNDRRLTVCLSAVGYTQDDWHARSVPEPAATKVRSCLSGRK